MRLVISKQAPLLDILSGIRPYVFSFLYGILSNYYPFLMTSSDWRISPDIFHCTMVHHRSNHRGHPFEFWLSQERHSRCGFSSLIISRVLSNTQELELLANTFQPHLLTQLPRMESLDNAFLYLSELSLISTSSWWYCAMSQLHRTGQQKWILKSSKNELFNY